MLELSPIIKSLWRNKTGPLLIIIQLALTIAAISNAMFVVSERMAKIDRPSGIAEQEIFTLWMRQSSPGIDLQAVIERDMTIIRSIPGVIDATPISSLPFSGSGSSAGMRKELAERAIIYQAANYEISKHGLSSLGLDLIEGRNFYDDEVIFFERENAPENSVVIISQHLAQEIFPDESAVGKTLYKGAMPLTVVGIVEQMVSPWSDSDRFNHAIFVPTIVKEGSINYLVRTGKDDRYFIMSSLIEKLRALDNTRLVVDENTMEKIKGKSYADDYAMIKILMVVIAMLILVNALGIFGLTTFWVNQRRKQIGIRRALGSTKAGIMRYFMLENLVLVIVAALLGTVLVYLNSSYMARTYGASLLPWYYIPVTTLFILIVTLAAAFSPVRRASLISPVEAVANV